MSATAMASEGLSNLTKSVTIQGIAINLIGHPPQKKTKNKTKTKKQNKYISKMYWSFRSNHNLSFTLLSVNLKIFFYFEIFTEGLYIRWLVISIMLFFLCLFCLYLFYCGPDFSCILLSSFHSGTCWYSGPERPNGRQLKKTPAIRKTLQKDTKQRK